MSEVQSSPLATSHRLKLQTLRGPAWGNVGIGEGTKVVCLRPQQVACIHEITTIYRNVDRRRRPLKGVSGVVLRHWTKVPPTVKGRPLRGIATHLR